jgi:sorting nexin-1/2
MSGFDDLLRQSSRALEENPFDDPFARPRSGSPDPWSSFTHQSATVGSSAFEYDASGFGSVSTTTPAVGLHDDSFSSSTVESNAFGAPTIASDPLDSANLPTDDEPESPARVAKPMTSPRYSGFRESVETDPQSILSQPSTQHTLSEPVSKPVPSRTVPPPLPSIPAPRASSPPVQLSSPATPSSAVSAQPAENASPPSPPPPSSARLPQRQQNVPPSAHPPFNPSSPTVSDSQRVISTPLDQPPVTSFASLALGGESFNGWDGAQSTFVNNASMPSSAQEEDDDDDDKPLRPRPVRIYYSTTYRHMQLTVVQASDRTLRKEGNRVTACLYDHC